MAVGNRSSTPRYETLLKLASGGMATVYVGTVKGALGFRQLVAIKRPHPHLFDDAEFRREFLAEARLASMIHHANVVDVRDIEVTDASINLVMDYIEGASVGEILVAASRGQVTVPPGVAVRIALDALAGLHAAHELTDEAGHPVGLVHRDVSPQNILVGSDGVSRVTDFGVAKFSRRSGQSTSDGALKGKLAYMAPEYIRGQRIDRRFDVFALGVVLWEMLTGKRLFRGEHEADTMNRVLNHQPEALERSIAGGVGQALDPVLSCALSKSPDQRFQSALAMAKALESAAVRAGLVASYSDVADLVRAAAGPDLEERKKQLRARLSLEPAMPSNAFDQIGPVVLPPPTTTAVPSTVPMTDGAMTQGVPTTQPMGPPEVSTTQPMISPPSFGREAVAPAPAGSSPAVSGSTLASGVRAAPAVEPFADVSAHTNVVSSRSIPVRRSPLPLIAVGVFVVTVVVGGGIFLKVQSDRASGPPATTVTIALSTTASATSGAVGAASAPVAASSSSAPAASSARSAPTTSKVVRSAATARPTAAPTETGPESPPPNPYKK
ncbi:MAG: protein kinase [Myxococcales bacterium]|jgi:serine/threonine-protein kinase|nr:protein kinase [Myxococcales bacterium]